MSFIIALKLFSDCCIIFAVLGSFPSVFFCSRPLLFMAAICALSAGLAGFASDRGKGWLSRLCALLPFAGAALAASPEELRILLPAAFYCAAVILRSNLHLEYHSYRQYFMGSLCFVGALFVLFSAFTVLGSIGWDEQIIHPEICLRYGIVHLVCGVVLQRRLRLGSVNQAKGTGGQFAVTLGGTVLALLGFVLAEPALRKGGATIFHLVLSIVMSAVMVVLDLFSSILDQTELEAMAEQVAEHRDQVPVPIMGVIPGQIQQNMQQAPDEPGLWWVFLVMLLLAAVVVLMFLSFRKKKSEPLSAEIVGKASPNRQPRRDPRRSYRWRIRQLYRDFLRNEKKWGLELKNEHTSLDVLHGISADTNAQGAAALRKVYISARYDLSREPGREDFEAAKAALKKCREQE